MAYSDLATTVHEPGRAYQWGTLVRPQDRGHRLGVAVKVANLRLLQRERPDIVRLTTYNAEVNAHMIGVNEAMGFAPGRAARGLPEAGVARFPGLAVIRRVRAPLITAAADLAPARPIRGPQPPHVRRAPQVNALMPVSARPISSFWICEVPS